MRCLAAAFLFFFPLLPGLTPEAQAQTQPQVNLSVSSATVTEGASAVTITATRSEANTSGATLSIPITVKTSGASAQAADYTVANSISIANNESSGTTTFTVTDDSVDEPQETVVIELGTPPAGTRKGSADEITIEIVDDDPTEVSLVRVGLPRTGSGREGSGAVSEGAVIEFTVNLSRPLIAGEVIEVPLSIHGMGVTPADWKLAQRASTRSVWRNHGVTTERKDTATPKVKFTGPGAQTATLGLFPVPDDTDEPGGETYVLALGPDDATTNGFDATARATNVGGGADPSATANTITVHVNEERTHTLSIAMFTTSANEGASGATATYPVSFPLAPDRIKFYANVCVSGTATYDTDYQLRDSTPSRLDLDSNGCVRGGVKLSLPRGGPPSHFHIFPIGDHAIESDETIILTVSRRTSGTRSKITPADVLIDSANSSVTFTLTNDDDGSIPVIPVVTIAPTTANTPITEGTAASYTLTATPPPSAALTVNLNVADVAGSDFIDATDEGAKTVTIPTTGTTTYTVATVNDSRVYEAGGDVTVTVEDDDANPVTYTVGSPAAASIMVEDNDSPMVSMRVSAESVPENGALTEATIRTNRDLSSALIVSYGLSGSATCGTDYTLAGADCAAATGTLTLPAGTEAFTEIELPVRLMADSVDDNGETIIVTLTAGTDYALGADRVYTATIYDDIGDATFVIDGNPHVGETVTIQRTQSDPDGDSAPDSYSWSWKADPDDENTDWEVISGQTTTALVVTNEWLGDYLLADVRYSDGDGYPETVSTAPFGPIIEPPPLPVLTLTGGSPINEGEAARFTVTSSLPAPAGGLVISRDLKASVFLDRTRLASNSNGVWTLAAGRTSAVFTVPTVCDAARRSEDPITVTLRAASSYSLSDPPPSATVQVNDQDRCRTIAPPSLSGPTFGAQTIPDQNWTRGQEIAALQFPQASGGTGTRTYTLNPAPPSGILYDAGAYRLSGTPAQALEQTRYAWIVTDGNGATATLPFTITITDVAELRIQDAVRSALSALARRSLSSAITNISARFADLSGSGLTLAGHAMPLNATPRERLATEEACRLQQSQSGWNRPTASRPDCVYTSQGLRSAELLTSSDFSFMLGASDTQSPQTPRWSLWGRGDRGSFAGGEPQGRYDGQMRGGWLGLDARAGAWVAGLAFSRSEGEANYHTEADRGGLETTLNGIYPYGRWTLDNGLEIRAVLGSGDGEARHTPEDGALQTSDLSMRLGSLGLRKELEPRGKIQRAFRLDASHASLKTQEGTELLHGLTADSWRVRAGLEISRKLVLPDQIEWQPFLEVAARKDGGDGLRGEGIELSGGVRYHRPGLSVEAKGRYLAAHSESQTRESGFSVTVRGGEGAGGRGLWFALQPHWGASATAGALWDDAMPQIQDSSNIALDARIGYGLSRSNGILTPFVSAGLGEQRTVRLGSRFESSAGLSVELVTEHIEDTDPDPGSALKLNLRCRF